MWKYSLLLSYLGSGFCGWQKQKRPSVSGHSEKPSVQATLEHALHKMTGETVSLVGSGRTDSGVHAVGQVAHFVLKNKEWNADIIRKGLNSLLSPSIQVLTAQPVALEFHAQRS